MSFLLLATRSADKIREIRAIMAASGSTVELRSLEEVRVPWNEREATIEDKESFLGNANAKAEYFARLTGLPTVAEDSGLEVLSLLGAPGVRSKRFAPGSAGLAGKDLDAANNAELLRRLSGAGPERRRASYVCVAVLVSRPGVPPVSFEGRCWGRILEEPRGSGGFGYDPLFFHEDLGQTFGELTIEEKNRVSHRGEAFRRLAEYLAAYPLR